MGVTDRVAVTDTAMLLSMATNSSNCSALFHLAFWRCERPWTVCKVTLYKFYLYLYLNLMLKIWYYCIRANKKHTLRLSHVVVALLNIHHSCFQSTVLLNIANFWHHRRCCTSLTHINMYTVRQKNSPFYFCDNFVKPQCILIIFGTQILK